MGDHVKVIAGRYEGDTGLIVRVEENFVILFSDLTMHEVSCFTTPSFFLQFENCGIVQHTLDFPISGSHTISETYYCDNFIIGFYHKTSAYDKLVILLCIAA